MRLGLSLDDILWEVPQDIIEELMLGIAREKEMEHKKQIEAVALGASVVIGGKEGNKTYQKVMTTTNFPVTRYQDEDKLFDDLEQYKISD